MPTSHFLSALKHQHHNVSGASMSCLSVYLIGKVLSNIAVVLVLLAKEDHRCFVLDVIAKLAEFQSWEDGECLLLEHCCWMKRVNVNSHYRFGCQ